MGAGTGVELVGNLFLKEFLVHVAVHLVEEVLGAAIEDDVHGAGLEQVGEVDDGVLVPIDRGSPQHPDDEGEGIA